MKILFIANTWMNIYKSIKDEMIQQGHKVTIIEDQYFKGDPNFSKSTRRLNGRNKKWEKLIQQYWLNKKNVLEGEYDILFVISGTSLNKWSVDFIKSLNPDLKTVFYTWDNCKHYNFNRNLDYFDKCYTFDIEDSKNDIRWRLLPIPYHLHSRRLTELNYDVFCMGSNHSNRVIFYKKILDQLKHSDIKFFLRVVGRPDSILTSLKLFFLRRDKNAFLRRHIMKADDFQKLLLPDPISNNEYNALISSSKCIIDDARKGQSGLTARFMWALANDKRILTTNPWALSYDFVDPSCVRIIDAENPIIPYDFVRESKTLHNKLGEKYSFSNWVKIILS